MPASQFKFRIPSVEDLKNLDPKQVVIEHGEKVILLACLVVLLITIVGLFVGGGEEMVTSEKMEKLIEDVRKLRLKPAEPFPVEDLAGEVNRWNEPPRYSDPWRVDHIVEEQIVLVGETIGPVEAIARHPDVKGLVRLRDPRVDLGFAWLLTECRPNQEHVQQFLQGLRPWDQIEITDVNRDVQFAVVTLWFDLGPLVADYARVLNVTRLDRQRNTLRLPHFLGFDVERQDLTDRSREGNWEPLTVPIPLSPDQRTYFLPQPPGWAGEQPEAPDEPEEGWRPSPPPTPRPGARPGEQPPEERKWPPPLTSPWEGGEFGLRSVQWVNPTPVEPERGSPLRPPPYFQALPEPGLPGGIFFSENHSDLVRVLASQLRVYLNAVATLDNPNATPGDQQNARRILSRPHGLGLRFVDTTVEVGRSYRYRLRIKVANPCVDLPNALPAAKEPAVLVSDFSPPSPVVTIPPDTEFFLMAVVPRATGVDRGYFEIHQLKEGRWRCEQSLVRVGEPIAYSGPVPEINFVTPDARPVDRWRGPRRPQDAEAQLRPVKVSVPMTLRTGAILLDIVPVQVLRAIYSRRPIGPEGALERDLLSRVTFLPETRYQAVFQDARGRVGVVMSGEMPPHAVRRRELSRERLAMPIP